MSIDDMKEALRDLEFQELSIAGRAALDVLRKAIAEAEDAVAAEREACAKVCEDMWHEWLDSPSPEKHVEDFYRANKPDAEDCAKAIRARGEK